MIRYLFLICFLLALPAVAHFDGDTPPPQCKLNHQDGSIFPNWQLMEGQVIYIDFWASWCPPCVKSFPFMNELSQEFKERGLKVIGVNLDEKRSDAESFLNRHTPHFTVVFDDDKQCAKDFNVIAMPSTYIIDKKGYIRHIHRGFRPGEADALRELIDALLDEAIQ